MNKHKNRSSQKQFLKIMVITGVLGVSVMMIAILYMIKLFQPQKVELAPDQLAPITQDKQELASSSMIGVVHQTGTTNKNIKIWDIEENKNIKMQIKNQTELTDSYGKLISKQEIQIGDILEVTYEKKSKDIIKIQKSDKAWERREVINPTINREGKIIQIGNQKYEYTSDILIINEQGEPMNMANLDAFDTLNIICLNNTIWSIQIMEAAGYIQLSNMPTQEGNIEIGNNQIYKLKEIQDKISLPPGDHKVVIRMDGYLPFSETITISTGQVYEMDFKNLQKAIAILIVKVTNVDVDYQVEINNKTYKKGETIQVKPGKYTLKLRADGFKTLQRDLILEDGELNLNFKLESTPDEPKLEEPKSENPKLEEPKPEKPQTEEPAEEIQTVQIIIETDPIGAQVFVGGVYKGTTPALTGLRAGEYSISIEKEGYSTLYSTIVIDLSNAQKGFLYTLQKE